MVNVWEKHGASASSAKNHMWGDALSELQNLTEKGNLQARHTLLPGLQTPRAKGAPDLTAIGHRGLDNSSHMVLMVSHQLKAFPAT